MHAYRFRILSEENEDFLMDVEVKATQTFLDFHNAIKKYCKIESNELASFYLCDDKWRKKTEIILVDMSEPENENENKKPTLVMENSVLNQVIINPHQRFLYVYDFLKMHTFYVELMSIKDTSPSLDYPALIKKEGEIKLNKPSGLLGFLDEDPSLEELPNDKESFFGEEADPEDLDGLESDIFFDDTL